MHSAFQAPPLSHMPYFQYNYGAQMNIPSPQSNSFVLDLSTKSKRAASPDYTYCYPSPKSSPSSNPNHEECVQNLSVCPQGQHLNERVPTFTTLPSCKTEVVEHMSTSSYSMSSPRSPKMETHSFTMSPRIDDEDICVDRMSPVTYPTASPRSLKSPSAISETTSESSFQSEATELRSPRSTTKVPRPFKTMSKDSVALSAGAIEQLDSTYSTSSFIFEETDFGPEETKRLMEESARKYAEFREKMLMQLHNNNNGTNQNMRRLQNNGSKAQDLEYLEKRRKNNEAAKRSRDARRYKQDEIAIRSTFLEQENMMLKYKVRSEVEDLERLRKMEVARNTRVFC